MHNSVRFGLFPVCRAPQTGGLGWFPIHKPESVCSVIGEQAEWGEKRGLKTGRKTAKPQGDELSSRNRITAAVAMIQTACQSDLVSAVSPPNQAKPGGPNRGLMGGGKQGQARPSGLAGLGRGTRQPRRRFDGTSRSRFGRLLRGGAAGAPGGGSPSCADRRKTRQTPPPSPNRPPPPTRPAHPRRLDKPESSCAHP